MLKWFHITPSELLGVVLTSLALYIILIVCVRIHGLRSFSKITSHDFAVTVAIGSILATTAINPSPSLSQGALAIGSLLLWKKILSFLRLLPAGSKLDNQPLLVYRDGQMLKDNLKKANLTESDLYAKMREANVLEPSQVRAIIIETTGDVSVLHGPKDNFDTTMLKGVRS
jgi:uncharacterized membrane protein YcaP (DUF421 family)